MERTLKMNFREKSKKEQLFVLCIAIFAMCLLMLCLCSCSGSCFGFSYGCKSGDYSNLIGGSYLSEGCCSNSSCKVAAGTLDDTEEDSEFSDIVLISCTHSSSDCCGNSVCSTGWFIGKDSDCGNWAINCASTDGNETTESTIGCIDKGCAFTCQGEEKLSWLYEIIYSILGI